MTLNGYETYTELSVSMIQGGVAMNIVPGDCTITCERRVLPNEDWETVKATVEANGKGEGNIGAIVKAIAPALKKVKAGCKRHKDCDQKDKTKLVECVVDENVKLVAANLTKQSSTNPSLAGL